MKSYDEVVAAMERLKSYDEVVATMERLKAAQKSLQEKKKELSPDDAALLATCENYVEAQNKRQKAIDANADKIAALETFPGELQGIPSVLLVAKLDK